VRADRLDAPDELRIDLDPVPGVEWGQIRQVAAVVRQALDDFGLIGWPKTSGSRGMHIYVRIAPRWSFDEVRRAALAFAREVERRAPALATSKWWKEQRHGVFLDYNQNAKDRTIAAAYSLRGFAHAPASAPVTWAELPDVETEDFDINTLPKRFAKLGDVHAGIDDAVFGIEPLLEWADRDEREHDLGDAPYPPNYPKMPGEPPRVQPSKKNPANWPKDQS
jgi:DNA primase